VSADYPECAAVPHDADRYVAIDAGGEADELLEGEAFEAAAA
jgi:hypothetical protein